MSTYSNQIGATSDKSGTNQTLSKAAEKALGKDEFLKLLTTELRNQDPLQPMDNKDFVAQMAQFSSLEQMNNVANSMDELKNSLMGIYQQSLLTQGAALIGKNVTGIDPDGATINGIVEAVKWLDGNPQLQIGDKLLDLSLVTEVSERNTLSE